MLYKLNWWKHVKTGLVYFFSPHPLVKLVVLDFLDKHFGNYIYIIHAYFVCTYLDVVLWCKRGPKKDGDVCKLIVLELLDQCFGNFLLHQSKVVCIHNRFSPYNPDNMVRTSPHVLIRSGGPAGIIIKVFFLSSNFLLNCQIGNSMYRRLGVMLHYYFFLDIFPYFVHQHSCS